jgi:hypothetical protein
MTGPRPYINHRPNENDAVDADFAGKRSFEAEEAARKRDIDPRQKDAYEPANPRGSGIEREYPADNADSTGNENIEGNRGAA